MKVALAWNAFVHRHALNWQVLNKKNPISNFINYSRLSSLNLFLLPTRTTALWGSGNFIASLQRRQIEYNHLWVIKYSISPRVLHFYCGKRETFTKTLISTETLNFFYHAATIAKTWTIRQRSRFTSRIWHASNTAVICIWLGTGCLVIKTHRNFPDRISAHSLLSIFCGIPIPSASFGGIFGLCLGGSVISLVELLYFFTLRLYSIIINGTASKFNDSKRVSISNHVKTVEMNPKSLLQDMKSYQQYERKPTWYKMRPSLTSIGHGGGGTILGRTAIHDFNKPGVQAFLK